MSEAIRAQVFEIIAAAGVTFSAQLIGATKRDNWECDEWRITLAAIHPKNAEVFQYFTGTGHRVDTPASKLAKIGLKNVSRNSLAWRDACAMMKPKAPEAADFLCCIIRDAGASAMSFADWCADFGYDEDSRKALETFLQCQKEGEKLRKLFDSATLAKLSEALQDY